MKEIDIAYLQKLMKEGRSAVQYAWEHYEELAARKHTYTLYGPYAYHIGASVPSKMTPKSARKLLKSTRRKKYLAYELDENFKVLRTVSVMNYSRVECVYHHFELGDATYAYPFGENKKSLYNDEINVIRYSDGVPVYFALVSRKLIYAQFYEYMESQKMLVSTYRFWPTAQYSMYGYPIDWKAPIGALNSPVDCHCEEEFSEYIDFANWFKQEEQ